MTMKTNSKYNLFSLLFFQKLLLLQKASIRLIQKVLPRKRPSSTILKMASIKDNTIMTQWESANMCTRTLLLKKVNSLDINSMVKEDRSSLQKETSLTTSAPSKMERRTELVPWLTYVTEHQSPEIGLMVNLLENALESWRFLPKIHCPLSMTITNLLECKDNCLPLWTILLTRIARNARLLNVLLGMRPAKNL